MAKPVPEGSARFYQIEALWAYPWNQWLDGQCWELTQSVDFPSTDPAKFRNQCKYMARAEGLSIRTRIKGDTLWIQAHGKLT